MRIALDAMGGDKAPDVIIAGALDSLEHLEQDDEIILVGPEDIVNQHMTCPKQYRSRVHIVHAPDVIAMDEPPVDSLRKKPKSSIGILAKLGKTKEADAVISAGNTGACVAAFQMRMRTLPNVSRPGIAATIPSFAGPVTVCDVGANIACKPIHLYQYSVMASIQAQNMLGIDSPRIGIMSIGQEESKGNEIVKKARDLIKSDPNLNFVGNIEGRDILNGVCDVVVCEGFVGNVMLKLTEGTVAGLFKAIKHELMQEKLGLGLALKFKPVMKRIYQKYDYNEYGGAPLLGVNGTAFICHGSSVERTIKNAVLIAKKQHTLKINDKIMDSLSHSSVGTTDAQTN